MITSDKAGHWYAKDGTPHHDADLKIARKKILYTSVSTICSEAKNYGLELYKLNQVLQSSLTLPRYDGEALQDFAKRVNIDSKQHAAMAADWGTGFHAAIENYEHGQPISDKYAPWIPFYQEFRETYIDVIVDSELILLDHDVPVAGRCDLIYLNPFGDLCLLDFKTTSLQPGEKPDFHKSWLKQLSAYRTAYRKMRSLPIGPRCFSVVINSIQPEPFHVKEWTAEQLDDGYQAFRHLACYWHYDRQYFPNGKPDYIFA